MLFLGRIIDWTALIALVLSCVVYLACGQLVDPARRRFGLVGRGLFVIAVLSIIGAVADLGTLLVTHRFDSQYVYEHSARAMDPLYWFPSLWAGQEGSFLLWAFWTGVLGVVLAFTAGRSEPRVMPIYTGVLIFLASMLVIRSPFLPLDLQGGPVPKEGLGLNPNLENPWMVIHPPTLFLGLSALTAPFAYALAAIIWADWNSWMRRALPWGLFGFGVLGLAMMMGGYWAYEMLGWGGFWGWDPVENGPLIPWLFLVGFLHSAQVQRVRRGLVGTTLVFAMLPFVTGLYETFLTRTGILEKFSVHSFSTLGGVGNDVLLYVLIASLLLTVVPLMVRRNAIAGKVDVWAMPASREFGYLMAVLLLTVCALISTIGMSAPLLTTLGMKLHLTNHVASVPEDYYNLANYPVAVLLAIGMGITPFLAWKSDGADWQRVGTFYGTAVIGAVIFCAASFFLHTAVAGKYLAAQLLLFAASLFALLSNGSLLLARLRSARPQGSTAITVDRLSTAGGVVSHIGVAVFLLGIVFLVTFVRKDPDVLLKQGESVSVLDGAYTMTYTGQTGDYTKDRHNALKFAVVSSNGRERFTALLPFALRSVEGGRKMLFGHPAIAHHLSGDLYVALKDGPDYVYPSPVKKVTIGLGKTLRFGPYSLQLVKFERDPKAASFVQTTGQMPDVFPVTAIIRVSCKGVSTIVAPQFVMHRDNPEMPDTPEVKLPEGWLISFQSMNAGSADTSNPDAGAMSEGGSFSLRADSGPPVEAFELDVTTRPMISLVWIGTMLLVVGGLLSMRRRIAENSSVVDEVEGGGNVVDAPERSKNGKNGHGHGPGNGRRERSTSGAEQEPARSATV